VIISIYKSISKIFQILDKSHKKKLILITFLTIFRSIFELLSISLVIPLLSFLVNFDAFRSKLVVKIPLLEDFTKNNLIILFIFLFILVYFLKTLFLFFYNFFRIKFCNSLYVELTEKILNNYFSRNYFFFLNNNSSKFVRNISSETNLFGFGVVGSLIDIFSQIIIIFTFCFFLIIYNFNTLYVILLISSFGLIIVIINNKKLKQWGEIRQHHIGQLIKKLTEIFGSIKEIIIYQKKFLFISDIKNHLSKTAESTAKRDVFLGLSAPLIEFLCVFIFFLFFLFLTLASEILFEEIIILFGVFAFASVKLLPTFLQIIRSTQLLRYNHANINLIFDEVTQNKNNYVLKNISEIINEVKKIIFENVSFSYPHSEKNILKNLNFEINAGDKIGIIGETGSGKTTLTNLISGLIEPSEGKILVNGLEYSNCNFFGQLGYVSQNVYLFDDTILSNITFEKKISKEQEIKLNRILEQLNLRNLVQDSPDKLNMVIGERGGKLSGGQIQRIGIARALYKNPNILLLDEATSSLDEETEEIILKNIFSLMKNKILIFSTHRKKVLDYCNKILEITNFNVTLKINDNISK
jgi:ABC-type multidrug transport system fused ATPase/permease subunit